MNKLSIIFCCSGWLGELSLRSVLKIPTLKIKMILTDRRSEGIIKIAQEHSIALFIGNPRSKVLPGNLSCDVIASVNYLFLLPDSLLKKARKIAFNIHGSLLPKYMGRTPVTWVIINDEIETGITVHEMVGDVDAGAIVYQQKVSISNIDTGGTLLKKLGKSYPSILKKVFSMIVQNRLIRTPQDLEKKSYFGKRGPEDGCIDWRWSARKIYNWVRAQTSPYPGAFGYVDQKKYRVWWVEETHLNSNKKPGTLFKNKGHQYIACGQGVIRLVRYEVMDR